LACPFLPFGFSKVDDFFTMEMELTAVIGDSSSSFVYNRGKYRSPWPHSHHGSEPEPNLALDLSDLLLILLFRVLRIFKDTGSKVGRSSGRNEI
jgi:hypothetical protein